MNGNVLRMFKVEKPIIGMIHLKTLPGSPNSNNLNEVLKYALKDAENLVEEGCRRITCRKLYGLTLLSM